MLFLIYLQYMLILWNMSGQGGTNKQILP